MRQPQFEISIDSKAIGLDHPTYFIADIAANHDSSYQRAIDLINIAAENGANATKFQHFNAKTIVSDFGFKNVGSKLSHQTTWKKSIYEVYKDAEVPLTWTEILYKTCIYCGFKQRLLFY